MAPVGSIYLMRLCGVSLYLTVGEGSGPSVWLACIETVTAVLMVVGLTIGLSRQPTLQP